MVANAPLKTKKKAIYTKKQSIISDINQGK